MDFKLFAFNGHSSRFMHFNADPVPAAVHSITITRDGVGGWAVNRSK